MEPRSHDEVVLGVLRVVARHAVPVRERAELVAVEPAGDGEHGDVDLLEVPLLEVQGSPVLVQRVVLQELLPERDAPAHEVVQGEERAVRQDRVPVERLGTGPLRGARGGVVEPVDRPPQSERAAEIGQLVEEASGRGRRDHAAQVGRALPGRQPLHGAQIRSSRRADVAVGPWLLRDPLDGVISVPPLAEIEMELPVRVAPPAHVLQHDRVAVAHEVLHLVAREHRGLEVGAADQDGGEAAVGVRQPHVGGEFDAVAHGYADIVHGARLRGEGGGVGRQREPDEGDYAPHLPIPPSVIGISTDSPQMWRANHSQLCHIAARRSRGLVMPWPKPL